VGAIARAGQVVWENNPIWHFDVRAYSYTAVTWSDALGRILRGQLVLWSLIWDQHSLSDEDPASFSKCPALYGGAVGKGFRSKPGAHSERFLFLC